MRSFTACLFIAATLGACRPSTEQELEGTAWILMTPTSGLELQVDTIRIEPKQTLRRVERVGSAVALAIETPVAGPMVSIGAKGACPVSVPGASLRPGKTVRKDIVPWVDFGPPNEQAGYDAEVYISAKAGCPEAKQGSIAWTQIAGEPLSSIRDSNNGFELRARTAPMRRFFPDALPHGVVPISPRTRGNAVLEARWTGVAAPESRYTITVAAAVRSTGLPNVPLGHRIYLSPSRWQMIARPDGSQAALQTTDMAQSLTPDLPGHYRVRDDSGEELSLFAQRYDATPLDCGRSDCHAELSQAAASSPMATILKRGLSGWLEGVYDAACASGCHSVGERGVHDGGFWDVARAIDAYVPAPSEHAYDELPAALRRVGGVGCLACHGPGTIPEPAARWAILRADVCAICHDAPPRYGHVAAWRASKMSRADHDDTARSSAECIPCHTTSGFLTSLGVLTELRHPPDDTAALGIGCAACHAPHAHGKQASAETPALLRAIAVPEFLAGRPDLAPIEPKSRICLPCHTPERDASSVTASAAAIWAGTGGVDPATAAPIYGIAPHTAVQGGCLGCHAAGPGTLQRGRSHAFAVDHSRCLSCHGPKGDAETSVRTRAAALYAELTNNPAPGKAPSAPLHPRRPVVDRTTPRGRALYDVLLVLEDPAAAAHNGAYARRLLDAAESALRKSQEAK